MSHEFAPAVVAVVTEHARTLAEPLDLAQPIAGPSAGNVHDFADAFRLRRKRDG